MGVYPVVLCGGAGARLWPASQPTRPKPFLSLFGGRSLFQAALERAVALPGAEPPIVIGGVDHADHISGQLAELGVAATVLLEPEGRETAAAVGACAAWIASADPQGVAVMIPSDHYLPDMESFAAAISRAVEGAGAGWIVTLGLKPTQPSTAYGYIRLGAPVGFGSEVARFHEKPDAATAAAYIAAGDLWNSGNLIARADRLLDELRLNVPAVAHAAERAVREAARQGTEIRLSGAFSDAPRISFDFAVMEKTQQAAVVPATFAWSDLGSWEGVWSVSDMDADGIVANAGDVVAVASRNSLVRAPVGPLVALVGVEGIAVVIENGVVLVTALSSGDLTKDLLANVRARGAAPRGGGE